MGGGDGWRWLIDRIELGMFIRSGDWLVTGRA